MPVETSEIEHPTIHIGTALLVKGFMDRLDLVQAIDQARAHKLEVTATYDKFVQAESINWMSLEAALCIYK